jgi:pilus assembly protein CpaE
MSHPGSVLAVLGAKGGVGSTTLAVHLATYLARSHGKRTLLIDQQASLGHACVYLGLDGGSFAFKEVVRNLQRMDSELLQGFVARHESGLEVMASPDAAPDGVPMHAADVSRTLDFLRGEYDYIVVDCDRSQSELLTPILQAAAQFYLVATPEISAVRDLSRLIDRMLVVEPASEKLQIVINRYNALHAIPLEQIEKAMKLSVAVRIPNQFGEMVRSANTGQPVLADNNGELAGALSAWAESVAGSPAKAVRKRKELRILSKWRQAIPAW